MPIYTFIHDETGEHIDQLFHHQDVPKIGETIEIDGKVCRRIFCGHTGIKKTNTKAFGYPFVSESLPRNEEVGAKRDKKGRQIIRSKNHEKQVLANMQKLNGLRWERA